MGEILALQEGKKSVYALGFIERSAGGGLKNYGSAIRAIQDIGCLSAAKFYYYFPSPIAMDIISGFHDCDIVSREFSKTIRLAKDLVSIKWPGEFSADFVIGGNRAVVYFSGSSNRLPQDAIDAFARRLMSIGYDRILYSDGPRPQCHRCPARTIKKCIGISKDIDLPL